MWIHSNLPPNTHTVVVLHVTFRLITISIRHCSHTHAVYLCTPYTFTYPCINAPPALHPSSTVMYECFSFILYPWRKVCKPALVRFLLSVRTRHLIYPAIRAMSSEVFDANGRERSLHEASAQLKTKQQGKSSIYVLRIEEHTERRKDTVEIGTSKATAEKGGPSHSPQTCKPQKRYISNGGTDMASLFTKQGFKGINQDTMLVIEKFVSHQNTIFGGVFDGHGRDGHLVARNVRDILPEKLTFSWQCQQQAAREVLHLLDDCNKENDCSEEFSSKFVLINAWKEAFRTAFRLTDQELLMNDAVDCITSGTTAVVVVRQGNDLLVGNVGDSRAILGARDDDGSLLAIQLTIDSKPDEPREAERIKRYDGRVFALQREPYVYRVWLPNCNLPGLAMSRALGDYCLKNNGLISVPEVTYRRLTQRDEFVVLATDGVWDVLSNEEVADIVSSTPNRAFAARAVVENALHAWRSKYAHWRADDCAAVCLFL